METNEYVLEILRQVGECESDYIEKEIRRQHGRGVLDLKEKQAIGHVASILRYWERQGRARLEGKNWFWLPETVKKQSQGVLFQ